MALLISATLFAIFALNIVLGSMGRPVFLTDVQEMLVLMASAVAFVVAILQAEARAARTDREEEN